MQSFPLPQLATRGVRTSWFSLWLFKMLNGLTNEPQRNGTHIQQQETLKTCKFAQCTNDDFNRCTPAEFPQKFENKSSFDLCVERFIKMSTASFFFFIYFYFCFDTSPYALEHKYISILSGPTFSDTTWNPPSAE